MSGIAVKVCGMREASNVRDLSDLNPDFIGFIFYDKSKRFVGNTFEPVIVDKIPLRIKKVGVFVNSSNDFILNKVHKYQLDFVQLHGDETPEQCQELFEKGIKIIKAFSVHDAFDFDILNDFEPFTNFFLFDTPGKDYGGNGQLFNWEVLTGYKGSLPFFLSGGISIKEVEKIKVLNIDKMYAVDLNSRFELEPGVKDIENLKLFIDSVK